VIVRLSYPEVFDLAVTLDRDQDVLGSYGTTSFNVTIANGGNGPETYALDYVHQTEDLLVSAVNETVDVAPGDSAQVEVFVSSLGTPVGGSSFDVVLTIRSRDDPLTWDRVTFIVSVRREFDLSAIVVQPFLQGFPGQVLTAQLTVSSGANYPINVDVVATGDAQLLETGLLLSEDLTAGDSQTWELTLRLREQILLGEYDLGLLVHEAGDETNGTVVTVPVSVLRVDATSISVNSTDERPLRQKLPWTAVLLLVNNGNHPELYQVNVTGAPGWMGVGIDPPQVVVGAYGECTVTINLTVEGTVVDAPGSLMLTVTAHPTNLTGVVPTAVLDVPLDIPVGGEEGSYWLMWLTLTLVMAVAILTVFLLRRR